MNRIRFCLLAPCTQLLFLGPSNEDRSVFNARLSCKKFLLFFSSLIFRIVFLFLVFWGRSFVHHVTSTAYLPFLCAPLVRRENLLWSSSVEIPERQLKYRPLTQMHPRTYTHREAPLRADLPLHHNSCISNYINWHVTEHKAEFRPDCIREVFMASQCTVIYPVVLRINVFPWCFAPLQI